MKQLLLLCLLAVPQQSPEAEQAAKRLRPPAGLQVDLVAAEPDFVNPVAFCIDEAGRFYVVETHRLGNCTYDIRGRMDWVDDDLACRSVADREAMHRKFMGAKYETLTASERVRLLEDKNGDGRVDSAVTFAEGFGTPADGIASGVLARKGQVWFANIPNLWRLKDADGDGKADVRTALHTGFGVRIAFIGHDLHGLTFGPDGKLYFSIGDRGARVEKDGKVLVDNPDSGCVMRCNPDGSGLELYATGLRNPQELTFDAYGNLWTCDNNCDAGDKARLVYVMEGGDSGWRIGYQQAPGRGPWMSEKLWELDAWKTAPSENPPVTHIGHGPSGFVWNGGVGLPEAYADHFFLANFPGNVLTWTLKPKGAAYEVAQLRTFMGDLWPTDVEIGNDGALYILDWVNGWGMPNKGRIFRVGDPARAKDALVLETKQLIAAGMGKRPPEELASLLGHRDVRVRRAAQAELAERGKASTALLTSTASKGSTLFARLHAVWGLGQLGAAEGLLPLLQDADAEVRAQVCKVLGEQRVPAALEGLLALLKDPSPRVRSFAAMAAGKLGRKEAVAPLLDLLRENADQDAYLRHAGCIALAWIGDAAALAARAKDESVSVRLGSVVALRRMGRPEVAAFLEDSDPSVVLEAARAINDYPVNAALPALAAKLAKGLPDKAWNRGINAAFRTGDAAALGALAVRKEAPEAARAEALRALADWEKPSGRDRVLHVWRPLAPRNAAAARTAVLGALKTELPNGVREAAAFAAGKLGIKEAAASLIELAGARQAPGVRIEALRALAALKDERLAAVLLPAAEDRDGNVKKEAAKLLKSLNVPNAAALLAKMALEGPVPVRQTAIASLAGMKAPEAEKTLGTLADALMAGTLPAGLRLDVLEALAKKPVFAERLARYEAARSRTDALALWRETLEGGDAESGRRIFFEKAEAGCLKCHSALGKGGIVGPDLSKIAAQKTRDYLLESIVLPNKTIAEGFAQVVLQLQNDSVETGRIEKESEAELVLILADGTRKKLLKSDVKGRKAGLSAMPEDVLKVLSKREVRDLVEFLASLK